MPRTSSPTDNPGEVYVEKNASEPEGCALKEKQRLGEFIEHFVAVAERREMSMPIDEVVTDPVNRAGPETAEIVVISDRERTTPEPIPDLERCLLSERTQDDLARLPVCQGEVRHLRFPII